MPEHDNEPVSDIPQLVPDRDELASYQQKHSKPKAREAAQLPSAPTVERGGRMLAYVVGLVAVIAIAAAAGAGYLYTELTDARDRVAALEQRLSTTDQSVNQSSVALQVKINELDTTLTQLRGETLKKYQAQMDQHGTQLAALDKSAKSVQNSVAGINRHVAEQDKALDSARAQIDKLPPLIEQGKQKAEQQQATIDSLSGRIKTVSDGQVKLDARLSNNEEWVESINIFRKQMNREIVNIKQQIAGSRPAQVPQGIQ